MQNNINQSYGFNDESNKILQNNNAYINLHEFARNVIPCPTQFQLFPVFNMALILMLLVITHFLSLIRHVPYSCMSLSTIFCST